MREFKNTQAIKDFEKACDGQKNVKKFAEWLSEKVEFTGIKIPCVISGLEIRKIPIPAERINKYLGKGHCAKDHKIHTARIVDPRHPLEAVNYCVRCRNIISWSFKLS